MRYTCLSVPCICLLIGSSEEQKKGIAKGTDTKPSNVSSQVIIFRPPRLPESVISIPMLVLFISCSFSSTQAQRPSQKGILQAQRQSPKTIGREPIVCQATCLLTNEHHKLMSGQYKLENILSLVCLPRREDMEIMVYSLTPVDLCSKASLSPYAQFLLLAISGVIVTLLLYTATVISSDQYFGGCVPS